jgi:hypothetical protein
MADPNVGQEVATVYEQVFGKKPTDNVFNSCALWYALNDKGFKEQSTGGRLFEESIEYAENTTHQAIAPTATLDTTIIDVFDAARFDVKVYAGTCSYGWLEELKAMGAAAKIDLISDKIENSRKSQIAKLNRDAWNTSTPGANELTALPTLVSITPTTGTVGGINRATFSFWRNRHTTATNSGTAFNTFRAALTSIFNQCSLGGVKIEPTHIIMDRASMEGLEQTMISQVRYTTDDRRSNGDPAFMNSALKFKLRPVMYDEDAPAGRAYLINNDILKFRYLSGGLLKLFPAVDPSNQLMNVHKLATAGNLTIKAGRHLGVVSAIT